MKNFDKLFKNTLALRRKQNISDLISEQKPSKKKQYIKAAVIFPIIKRRNNDKVILTKRPNDMNDHPGQICFPGGKYNKNDKTMENCAKREAKEEIGLESFQIDVLGELDYCFTGTGFKITPVIARINENFIPDINKREVEDVFEVPLNFFLDEKNRNVVSGVYKGKKYSFYEYNWKDKRIWGLTAKIIVNFCDIIKELNE